MAVTANQTIRRQEGERAAYPVAATTRIYEGTMAFANSSGNLTNVVSNGANKFAGIAIAEQDNSGGAAGDLDCELKRTGVFELKGSGFAAGDEGKPVYATDNYTLTLTATNASYVGEIVQVKSATVVMVNIRPLTGYVLTLPVGGT